MAEKTPAADIVGDMTRESLIALSYTLPQTDVASPESPEKTTDDGNTVSEKDVQNLRSELISLSYTSPDADRLPEFKG